MGFEIHYKQYKYVKQTPLQLQHKKFNFLIICYAISRPRSKLQYKCKYKYTFFAGPGQGRPPREGVTQALHQTLTPPDKKAAANHF